jgi:hypothetical protein
MSLPVTVFYCTECDFESGNLGVLGIKEYVLTNGVRIHVPWTLGLCGECNSICAAETLNKDFFKNEYSRAKQERHALPLRPVRYWWQLHRFLTNGRWQQEVQRWESDYVKQANKLADWQDLLRLLDDRKSAPRCLKCGGHHLLAPLIRIRSANREMPKYTGSIHPGCGGEIWMKEAEGGLRIALRQTVSRYTPEGEFIEKIDVGGYTVAGDDYFDSLEKSNASLRKITPPQEEAWSLHVWLRKLAD